MAENPIDPQDETQRTREIQLLQQEVRDAKELLEYAIGMGLPVPDKTVDSIKRAENFLLENTWPENEYRSAFEKAYRDLAQFMQPVNVETLHATRDSYVGPRRRYRLWMGKRSDARVFSTQLWCWAILSVVIFIFGQLLGSLYFPNEENAHSAGALIALTIKELGPFVMGLLGASTYLLRAAHGYISDRTFDMKRTPEYYNRLLLGFIGGGIVLLFVDPKSVGYGQDAICFTIGYSTDTLFDLVERVAAAIAPKPQDTPRPGVAKVEVSPKQLGVGAPGTVTVTLKAAARAEGVSVSLSASPSLTMASQSVTVPASAISAQVNFTVKPGSSPGQASIMATANGSSASDNLTIT